MARVARHARLVLVVGLFMGLAAPGLAARVAPYVPVMIAGLLFLNAFRAGDRIVESLIAGFRRSVVLIALLQVALPLSVLGAVLMLGQGQAQGLSGFAFFAVLMLASPSLTGATNFMVMLGRDPTGAMRLLVLGTCLFPLTAYIVLWAMPGIAPLEAVRASLRLVVVILVVVGAGTLARRFVQRRVAIEPLVLRLDGVSALLLGLVVIGLMAEVGPALRVQPVALLGWVLAVCALNLTLLWGGLRLFRAAHLPEALSAAIVAGNRNIALFLIALPPEVIQPAMLFIGCYQIPMYLTPIVLRRLAQ